jgi:hypothetical protein
MEYIGMPSRTNKPGSSSMKLLITLVVRISLIWTGVKAVQTG